VHASVSDAAVQVHVAALGLEQRQRMLRADPLHERLLLVGHNGLGEVRTAPRPGHGSCIFVHVWRFPDRGTDGCYATSLERVEDVIRSVEPGRGVLVALPRSELNALRDAWHLP
jgi:L,D-peptidoglycan transpeptidase YkuD (ErfK/YbiS/YcfS/YnhG family)